MDNFDMLLKEKAKAEKYEIPASLDNKIDSIVNNLPPKSTGRRRIFPAAFAAAILIITMSVTVVFGKSIPILGGIIEYFSTGNTTLEYGGDINSLQKYAMSVNKTFYDNGVSITIDAAACDGNFLVLFYTMEGKGLKDMEFHDGLPSLLTCLDFKRIIINGKEKQRSNNDNRDSYRTKDGKVKGMIRADISNENLPDKFTVEFLTNNVLDKTGNSNFKFDVSKGESTKDSKVFNVNKEAHIEYPDGRKHDIKIEKVSLTPFGNQIVISEKFKSSASKYDINAPQPFDLFALFDDKGNALDVLNGQRIGSPTDAKNSFEFVKCSNNIKSITLIPIRPYGENGEIKPLTASLDKFPLELKVSDKGSYVIEKIEYGNNETRVYYTEKGMVLFEGFFQFIDEHGEDVFSKSEVLNKDYITDRQKGTHVGIFPKLDKNKKYSLKYYPSEKFDLLDQYKVVIPLE